METTSMPITKLTKTPTDALILERTALQIGAGWPVDRIMKCEGISERTYYRRLAEIRHKLRGKRPQRVDGEDGF